MEKSHSSQPSQVSPTNWILIRGMSRASDHWGSYPKQFEHEVEGAHVYSLDVPGTGKLLDKKSPTNIAEMTDFLRQSYRSQVPVESLALPTFLMGMSMGGMIVLDWLDRYPDDLAGAITINTSAGKINPVYRRLNPTALFAFLRIGATRDPRQREKLILNLTAQNPERRNNALDAWSDLAVKAPITLENSARQLLASAQFRLPRTPPRKPLLLLNAAYDRIAHPCCSRKIAERWRATLKTHPRAGHDLPIDDPQWIIEAVQEWRKNQNL